MVLQFLNFWLENKKTPTLSSSALHDISKGNFSPTKSDWEFLGFNSSNITNNNHEGSLDLSLIREEDLKATNGILDTYLYKTIIVESREVREISWWN